MNQILIYQILIEELTAINKTIENRIHELEGLTTAKNLNDMEFDILRQMLTSFSATVNAMTIEQKRTAIRTFVRKVIWDGSKVHVVLFGADENYVELPTIAEILGTEDDKNLDLAQKEPQDACQTPWGEDSKCNSDENT